MKGEPLSECVKSSANQWLTVGISLIKVTLPISVRSKAAGQSSDEWGRGFILSPPILTYQREVKLRETTFNHSSTSASRAGQNTAERRNWENRFLCHQHICTWLDMRLIETGFFSHYSYHSPSGTQPQCWHSAIKSSQKEQISFECVFVRHLIYVMYTHC